MTQRLFEILIQGFTRILIPGLTMTIPMTVLAFTLSMAVALVIALAQFARIPVLTQFSRFYIWVFRGTPLLVQLFIIYYGLGQFGLKLPAFVAGVIALGLNEGAYCAETVRSALESVPVGQLEAGACVGLTWWQTIRRIVLPQAMRTAFPPLGNSLIAMLKDTSLVSNITVAEMFVAAQRMVSFYYEPLAIYLEVGVFYLIFSTVISRLERWGEKKLNAYEYK